MRLAFKYAQLKSFEPLRRINESDANSQARDSKDADDDKVNTAKSADVVAGGNENDDSTHEADESAAAAAGTDAGRHENARVAAGGGAAAAAGGAANTQPARNRAWASNEIVVAVGRLDERVLYDRLFLFAVCCLFVVDIILLALDVTATSPNPVYIIVTVAFRALADAIGLAGFVVQSWVLLLVFSLACAYETMTYMFLFYDSYQAGRVAVLVILWGMTEVRRAQLQIFWFVPFR